MDRILAPVVRFIPQGVTPNMITSLRIVLVPVIVGSYYIDPFFAVTVYAFACMTDAFDGAQARQKGLCSQWGKRFDEVVDKLFLLAIALLLWWKGLLVVGLNTPFVCVCAITVRESVITALRRWYPERTRWVPSLPLAKLKTFALMVSFGLLMVTESDGNWFSPIFDHLWYPGVVFLLTATVLAIVSGFQYIAYFFPTFENDPW